MKSWKFLPLILLITERVIAISIQCSRQTQMVHVRKDVRIRFTSNAICTRHKRVKICKEV